MEDTETATNSGPLYLGPVRRKLSSDAEFFDEGNTNRALLCKINVFAIIARGGEVDEMDILGQQDQQRYECMFQDCTASFSSLKRHEEHYETSHRNRCSACGRTFPTHRLLDFHLSEAHDSFFRAMAERRPMYACLVEGCSEVFETSGKRHTHLIDAHRYPERFDFSRPSYTRKKTGAKKSTGGRRRGGNSNVEVEQSDGRKERLSPRGRKSSAGSEPGVVLSAAATAAASGTPGAATQSSTECFAGSMTAPANTRSACKQRNLSPQQTDPSLESAPRLQRDAAAAAAAAAAAPRKACKFWSTAVGCRAGVDCKFRHDTTTRDGGKDSDGEGGGGGGDSGGAKEWYRLGGGGVRFGGGTAGGMTRRGGGLVSGMGLAEGAACVSSAKEGAMEEDGGNGASGSIDELVSGMSKLLIPRQLGFGSSARIG